MALLLISFIFKEKKNTC